MLRRYSAILAAVMVAGLLAGCSGNNPGAPTPTATAGQPITAEFEQISSGGKALEDINAKALTLEHQEDSATVTLQFVLGSQLYGGEEFATDDIPSYTAYCTGDPARFVLEFESMNYWDYSSSVSVDQDDPIFYTIFKQVQSNDNRFRIFFQLKQNVSFKVTEGEGSLTIQFSPAQAESKTQYFVTADAISQFSEGSISDDMGLFPTLCSDLHNTILISKPYPSQQEAESAKAQILEKLSPILPDISLGTVSLTGNELPEYIGGSDYAEVYEHKIVSKNGIPSTLPVVIPDGMYLCSTPDGRKSIFSRQLKEEQLQDTDDTIMNMEELWIMDAGGALKRLSETEFATIEMASFSPDGRKLAILERAGETSYLYVYDMDTNTLSNLSEEGLGQITSNFIWDVLGSAIFAISGNESMQLLKYDFTILDETQRISAVEERTIEEGDLAFYNSDLYFANVTEEGEERIYKIKPEGGMRAEFATGGSFRMSPDGRYMVILESAGIGADDEETVNNTSLKLKNMSTGEEAYLVKDRYIVSFDWAPNGILYYTEGNDASAEEEYGFTLFSFNIETKELTECVDMVMADFFTTPDPNTLYLPYMYISDETRIRATYQLDLRTLSSAQ